MSIPLHADLHTHSSWTDGADSPALMAAAAAAAGLTEWGLSDHVRADSDWLPDYAREVRALRVDGVTVRCGVEAKMLTAAGGLDLPTALPALDYLLVADHQFPGTDGPVHPRVVREQLERGEWSAPDVIEILVRATIAALAGSPLPPIVAHLFSLLPKCGLTEDAVSEQQLAALSAGCLAADAAVEINEKWQCPSQRVLTGLVDAGVRLVAGSDAHARADVGRWRYALDAVAAPA